MAQYSNGYKVIYDPNHPRAYSDGNVYEHIVVAEKKLNRPLTSQEVVHHKDFDITNNNPDNLMVFATNSEHTKFHKNHCDENLLEVNEEGIYSCKNKTYTCLDCGANITKYGTRCKKCAWEYQKKVKNLSKEELYKKLQEAKGNFSKVGREYGVTSSAVHKWCKAYGLPHRAKDYKQ